MKNVVMFDLGNTLVHYFEKHEFHIILTQAIAEVQNYLIQKGIIHIPPDDIWRRVNDENYESRDHKVRHLEERLIRIFRLDNIDRSCDIMMDMCRFFIKPVFFRAYCYKDTLPTLKELKLMGYRMALVSNTTWGSPANLWREHLEHLGLLAYFDAVVFCRDVGWRKPAKQIFEYTLQKLQALPQQSVFVGDDPKSDIAGAMSFGIDSILIDRNGRFNALKRSQRCIKNLTELVDKLKRI